jgi:hypothetical protein
MTKKIRLIPFDYQKYLDGAKAVLRNSDKEIVKIYPREEGVYSFLLVCKDDETNYSFYSGVKIPNDLDVLLEEQREEKTFYVNVFKNGVEHLTYNNKDNAIINQQGENFIGMLQVTYTDEDLIK